MNVYVARQAIFDMNKQVVAYELLFRNSEINKFTFIKNLNPTFEVIRNSFSAIGIDKITEGKKAFINFDEETLKSGIIETLSKNYIVVEILETVKPDEAIIECCKNLKRKGYIITLDDFEYNDKFNDLMKYVDIIKVDFIINKGTDRKKIISRVKNKNIKFLAEKVETEKDYREALKYGYSYFQGYFFCKPTIISGTDIDVYKSIYIKLIKELSKDDVNIESVKNLIKSDVALSYKLLKIANSAHYGMKNKITSIRNAIMIIGISQLKRWIFIIGLKSNYKNGVEELVRISIIRGYFGELIANKIDSGAQAFQMFLTGLFSLIDVLVNKPLYEILNDLPVSDNVRDALLGKESILGNLLRLIINYEKGSWKEVSIVVKEIGLDEEFVKSCYLEAIESAKEILEDV